MDSTGHTRQAQVCDQLRDAILKGELPPETRISERKLCELLGATRGPVRESLIRLEAEGFVRKTPSHAYYVRDLSEEDKQDIYRVRLALERIAARKAALSATREDRIRLAVICEEENEAFLAGDEEARLHCDRLFHQQLIRASGSPVLRRIFALVALPVLPAAVVDRAKLRRTVREHAAICQAIRKGDAETALRVIEKHLSRGDRWDAPGVPEP